MLFVPPSLNDRRVGRPAYSTRKSVDDQPWYRAARLCADTVDVEEDLAPHSIWKRQFGLLQVTVGVLLALPGRSPVQGFVFPPMAALPTMPVILAVNRLE